MGYSRKKTEGVWVLTTYFFEKPPWIFLINPWKIHLLFNSIPLETPYLPPSPPSNKYDKTKLNSRKLFLCLNVFIDFELLSTIAQELSGFLEVRYVCPENWQCWFSTLTTKRACICFCKKLARANFLKPSLHFLRLRFFKHTSQHFEYRYFGIWGLAST